MGGLERSEEGMGAPLDLVEDCAVAEHVHAGVTTSLRECSSSRNGASQFRRRRTRLSIAVQSGHMCQDNTVYKAQWINRSINYPAIHLPKPTPPN